jgi:hypothetical protein
LETVIVDLRGSFCWLLYIGDEPCDFSPCRLHVISGFILNKKPDSNGCKRIVIVYNEISYFKHLKKEHIKRRGSEFCNRVNA